MNREALDKFFERGILTFVLAILVFAPLAMGAVDAWAFLVVQGLSLGVLVFWVLRIWVSPKPQLLWPPICWVMLTFMVYAVARYWTADIEYVARQEMIQVLLFGFLFFAIVNNLYRQEFSQIISFTVIFLAAGISCYATYQYMRHSNQVWIYTSPYHGRASGTYISPNDFAGFLEMVLPLSLAYILAGRMKAVTRILLGYAALGLLVGLTVTFSRGGWAAAGIAVTALLIVLIFHRNHRLPAMLMLVVLIGGGSLVVKNYLSKSLTYMNRVQGTLDTDQDTLDFRRDMWIAAERMWLDNFWIGVGPAHYDYRFPQYRSEHIQARPDRAHNDYLNLLADWGTIGGIIVLAGMIVFVICLFQTNDHVRRAEKDFGRSGRSNRFAFFIGALTALLALAVHSVVDFNLHIPANAIFGVTLLALLTSNLRFATENYWLNLRQPMRILITIFLGAGVFYLGAQEYRRANETYWISKSENLKLRALDRATVLENAYKIEPQNPETVYEIAEFYRLLSFDGGADYEQLAKIAMDWYSRGMKLNRYDSYNYIGYGMCLDWLEKHDEAKVYFEHADEFDPNNYYVVGNVGWHYFQIGDYAAARTCFQRSLNLEWHDSNTLARSYLQIIEQKMKEQASNEGRFP